MINETDIQAGEARADSLHSVVGASGPKCVSCGAPAVLKNYDGEYCKECMQLHLVEKMFVNLTAMQRPRTNAERLKRQGEIFNHDGKCGKITL